MKALIFKESQMQIAIKMLNKTLEDCKCEHDCCCGKAEKTIIQGLMHQKTLEEIKRESFENLYFSDQFVPGIIDKILESQK